MHYIFIVFNMHGISNAVIIMYNKYLIKNENGYEIMYPIVYYKTQTDNLLFFTQFKNF